MGITGREIGTDDQKKSKVIETHSTTIHGPNNKRIGVVYMVIQATEDGYRGTASATRNEENGGINTSWGDIFFHFDIHVLRAMHLAHVDRWTRAWSPLLQRRQTDATD